MTQPDYTRHTMIAEAKARALAIDAYKLIEEMAGWAVAAQLDDAVIAAVLEARSGTRRVRNLLLPDELFPDEVERLTKASRVMDVVGVRVSESDKITVNVDRVGSGEVVSGEPVLDITKGGESIYDHEDHTKGAT